ncbi:MAG: 50S ribosomal protein L22 [Deltaproteobacteria bacterium]|jgi:large subunit ribosomal protein L22|nr:50S ribosomal protein L22 [Deltaproteobacteria bacterium]
MEASATARFVRVSPRKARLVVDLIRGKRITEAQTVLMLAKKASASIVKKVLNSAVANAGQTGVIDLDTLYVKKAYVDLGASQKRFRPAPMGRAHKYRRRTSHITIVVDEK